MEVRYEDHRTGNRFWAIKRLGRDLEITFGRRGRAGRSRVESFRSPEVAEAEKARYLRRLWKKGYRPGSFHPELFAAIVAEPQRSEPYEKYATWLGERGDPRAELIKAGLVLRQSPSDSAAASAMRSLLEAHPRSLNVALMAHSEEQVWDAGFVRQGHFIGDGMSQWDDYVANVRLRFYLQHPSCALLTRLRIHHSYPDLELTLRQFAPLGLVDLELGRRLAPAWPHARFREGHFVLKRGPAGVRLVKKGPDATGAG